MFDKLFGRFRRNSKNSSSSSDDHHDNKQKTKSIHQDDDFNSDDDGEEIKHEEKEQIVIVHLSKKEAAKYRDLMRQEDINHSIIMGGYLRWKDVVSCMCVCRDWRAIIDCSSAYDMLLCNIKKAIENKYPVKRQAVADRLQVGINDSSIIKELVAYGKYFLRWYKTSGFGYNSNMESSSVKMLLNYMSINPDSPINIDEKKIHIPEVLKGNDYWFGLTSPSWNQDEKDDFGLLMAFQIRFQYRYLFYCIAHMHGIFYKVHGNVKDITKEFVEGNFEEEEEEEVNLVGRQRSSSNRVAEMHSISEYTLDKLTDEFAVDRFLDEDESTKADASLEVEFCSNLRKILFKVWKSGLLYCAPVRDYIFQLLFLLADGIIHDYHTFHFHNKCTHSETVINTVHSFLSARPEDSETLHSYLLLKKPCSGYSGGSSKKHYFVALTIKQSPTRVDECEFEFVKYHYYSHTIRGMALS